MIGYGQKARMRAERVCSRLSDTPETPGEAWGPPFSVKRRYGTESPRVVLTGATAADEPVSTGYGTVGGFPKKPRPLGTPADRPTWGR